jgi:hypothetical protein
MPRFLACAGAGEHFDQDPLLAVRLLADIAVGAG